MKINIEDIIALAGKTIYSRGVDYFHDGRVILTHIEEDSFEAVVDGTYHYHVSVEFDGDGFWAECDCPYPDFCKHSVAALLAARQHYQREKHREAPAKRNTWISLFNQAMAPEGLITLSNLTDRWELIYILKLGARSWTLSPKKQYIKKDGSKGRLSNIQEIRTDDNTLLYSPNDPLILTFLKNLGIQDRNSYYNYQWNSYPAFRESFPLQYGEDIGAVLKLLRDSRVFIQTAEDTFEPAIFDSAPCSIDFRFEETQSSYQFVACITRSDQSLPFDNSYTILTANPVWLIHGNTLIHVDNLDRVDLLKLFTVSPKSISIPKNEFPKFIETVYPYLASREQIHLPESIPVDIISEMTGKKLFLSEKEDVLQILFHPVYGEATLDFDEIRENLTTLKKDTLFRIERNMETENSARKQLIESGLKLNKDNTFSIKGQKGMDWFFIAMPQLMKDGFEIEGWNELKKFRIRSGAPNVKVQVSSKIDWFDLNVSIDIEGILLSIKELKKSIKAKSRFVKLDDGSYGRLSDDWFANFEKLFDFTEQENENFKAKRFQITLIDQLFSSTESFQADADYEHMLKKLSSFECIKKQTLPATLAKTLRPYQKSGVDWLYFLQEFGFGGCLADDMGLGKTLQALSVLLMDKQSGEPGPSLIVCPTSVVFNWQKEIEKFTSELTVYSHTGVNRVKNAAILRNHHVVLTSYGILLRDIKMFREIRFHYVILDESQKIKNPASQSSKAVRLLNGNHRLVLTGTPVENNTTELWSQFAFLNPGFLGSLNHFKQNFATPIEKHGEQETANMLQKIIFPFILRRTKEHVAKELPPKTEQIYFCTMSPAQEKIYHHWRNYYRGMLLDKIDHLGFDKSRMNVLEGLVKLRQIACHPRLVDAADPGESGKMETLKELIDEITAEGHKILIFSQFVKMLKIVRDFCDTQKLEYAYLDGRTLKREACVDRFQNDDSVKLFLISLKAGGTGLNLTAADYVIHVDPWWNPAVEAQATDRAHRIGQDKKVIVYKLISQNTVEEKMLKLQDRKRALVKNLIGTDEGFMKNLTREDVELLFE